MSLILGCNTWAPSEYDSEVTITSEKSSMNDMVIFLINIKLNKKTCTNTQIIDLPPFIATYDSNGLAWIKTKIDGLAIESSIDIKERKDSYDVLHYKLNVNDNDRITHHEERLITVFKKDKITKSILRKNGE